MFSRFSRRSFIFTTAVAFFSEAVVLPRQSTTSILIGNDDGWAEANVRAFYAAAKGAGYQALISSPTENKSGTGSLSRPPSKLSSEGQYGTIPAGSPAVGQDPDDDHIWYVNSYPVDGIKFGFSDLVDEYFGGKPTLVATGPNVGGNLGLSSFFSGTVGAAIEGSNQGVPAIAFSGSTDDRHSYKELTDGDASSIYAEASVNFLQAVLAAGAPYLPDGVILSVNYPEAGPDTECKSASDIKFVQSRVYWHLNDPRDVVTCNNGGVLPTETSVVETSGCYASVSAMKASNKLDAAKVDQETVNMKLAGILTCLP